MRQSLAEMGAGVRQRDLARPPPARLAAPHGRAAHLKREVERRHKRGSVRFVLLVLTLILTAAIVTVVMFRTLYLLR